MLNLDSSANITRPVLMVPVSVPACPYAASASMIMSQSGSSGWTSWVIPSSYLTSLDRAGSKTASSSPNQLYPDSRRWEKPVSPHDSDKGTVFFWCGYPHVIPMLPLDSFSGLPNMTEDFGDAMFPDISLWDSPRPDNWKMNSRISGGILAAMIPTLFGNCNLCTATAHSWMHSTQMRHTVFWSN